jgi:hypothetical protein
MNAQFGSAFSEGRSPVHSSAQQPQAARLQNAAAHFQASARPAAAPQQAAQQAGQQTGPVRADLDLSDTALVRRDVPRGSLINIVA